MSTSAQSHPAQYDHLLREAGRMSEDDLLARVRHLCRAHGLLHYHTEDSRGSERGYPDCHIVGPNGSLFRELKTERGRLSQAQTRWCDALQRCGHDVAVWRPSDLLSNTIKTQLTALNALSIK